MLIERRDKMKKIFSIFLFLTAILGAFSVKIVGANRSYEQVEVLGATYQVTNRINESTLDYGIKYIKDIAKSSSSCVINGTKDVEVPQVLNVLEVPSTTAIKVVNWTYANANGWIKQTVTNLAKDFERNNPGWVVLAGINGDFFDINGKQALPYQTNGAAVNNSDVVRSTQNETQIGFTNDGTTNSLVVTDSFEVSKSHYLVVYDSDDNVIAEYEVSSFNENPKDNEVSVWFSYHRSNTEDVTVNLPDGENSFLVESAERCYPTSSSVFYGKGNVSKRNSAKELYFGQFGIVSNNHSLNILLENYPKVRVQQNLVGDYAACDNVTGGGAKLILNNKANNAKDGMSDYRHPRTVIGQKEDGTIVMATVDGRQEDKQMYGMTYEELSAAMTYYGCSEAYNLDGGGSTTMIIRNENGEFNVVNSPSDGEERRDSNAVFVVAPEMSLSITQVIDTKATVSYVSKAKDILISNVVLTLEDEMGKKEYRLEDTSSIVDGLNPNTDYSYYYSYDLTYKGKTIHNTSHSLNFSTGVERPKVKEFTYEIIDDMILLNFEIEDNQNVLIYACIKYSGNSKTITKQDTSLLLPLSEVQDNKFIINLTYNVGAKPNSLIEENIELVLKEEEKDKETEKEVKNSSLTLIIAFAVSISSLALISIIIFLISKKNKTKK